MNPSGVVATILGGAVMALAKKKLDQTHHPENIQDKDGSNKVGYLAGSTPVMRLLDNRVTPIWGHFRLY